MKQLFSKQSYLALFIVLGMGGCASQKSGVEESAYPWAAKVEKSSAFTEIILPLSKQSPSKNTLEKIKDLIAQMRSEDSTYVRFLLTKPAIPEHEALARNALAELSKKLVSLGIARKNIETVFLETKKEARPLETTGIPVMVSVEQYRAFAPDCSLWDPMPGTEAGGEKNFGCSTASNLTQMIVSPKDLVEGQAMSPTDGARNAIAVKNYETDKIKDLKVEKVDTGTAQ